ncbi:MAG TPA: hypothetical protein VF552_04495 [Allosphingosinicella sp.]|jgi:hypothetical protein
MRIDAQDYDQMKSWFAHMAGMAFAPDRLTPEADPIVHLEQIERRSRAKARTGLAMAIGDLIEVTGDWSVLRVAQTDRLLAQHGLPTLTNMRLRFSAVVYRVLKRGCVKDDVEYHAVRNAVELAGGGGAELWSLLAAYESKQGR